MQDQFNTYIDVDTIRELDILRRMFAAQKQLREVGNKGVSAENSYITSGLYGQIQHLMLEYEEFIKEGQQNHDEAVGVIVGRFQVSKLHDGHKYIINTVKQRHASCGVAIGVAIQIGTSKNPLNYSLRASMISHDFPDCVAFQIKDRESNKEWSNDLDALIVATFNTDSVRLYGGRDSFIPFYHGRFPVTEIAPTHGTSGTALRDKIGTVPINDVNFRKGIIFASQRRLTNDQKGE